MDNEDRYSRCTRERGNVSGWIANTNGTGFITINRLKFC